MSNTEQSFPKDIVPCKVVYQNRKFTDIAWGVCNVLCYVAYLITGFIVVSQSNPRHQTLSDGSRGLSEYYMESAESCCANTDEFGYVCTIYLQTLNNGSLSSRRLAAGGSKFDGDEGIFDSFIEAPGIIVGLLSMVLGLSVLWVVLLRFFAKPIVILVEAVKIALMITVGVYQQDRTTSAFCFVFAALMVAYVIWQWKRILFAAKVITHSTVSLKENPSILFGSLLVKVLYAGNAGIFVLFFAKSFDAVKIAEIEVEGVSGGYCDFIYPQYVQRFSIFWSLAYLWTLAVFQHMRLSIIATVVGSWHFHPDDKPSIFKAIANVGTSFGTLSVSSLITAISEKVNRMMSEGWKSWISPLICVTWPFQCIMCVFGSLLYGCVRMLTSYAVVLHVFTGENFLGSARHSFNILSRHFKGGFVTEITSRSVFSFASYTFSFCVALVAWVWIDSEFNAGSLPSNSDDYLWILYVIVILFNIYYPSLGIYIMIIANRFLREYERSKLREIELGNADFENTNNLWIPPLAATFVACIAMMFFTFLSSMFNDIITTLFLCFAVDKDNNVDLDGQELEAIVKEVPYYIKKDKDVENAESQQPVAVAFPVN